MERKYEIWQLRKDGSNPDLLFRSWGEFLKKGVTPSPLTHAKVYEGSLPEIVSDEEELLEEIYTKFNMDNPSDFKGHSLSISDVIVLDRDGHRQGYFVDPFGFKAFEWCNESDSNDFNPDLDWVIDVVNDHYCQECGQVHDKTFPEYMCDAHTHGLDKYGHDELQIVVLLPLELIGYILNTLGERIKNGEKIVPGKDIENVIAASDGSDVVLKAVRLEEGITRIILPDENFKYACDDADDCMYPYNMQMLPMEGGIMLKAGQHNLPLS